MILSLQISALRAAARQEQLSQVLGTGNTARDAPALELAGQGWIRAAQLPAAASCEPLTHGKPVSHEQSRAITGTPEVCTLQRKSDTAFRGIYRL